MAQAPSPIALFTPRDVSAWLQSERRQIFLGDVLDASNSQTMGVGFARYAPGESNRWVVTYDEVLIVTRGAFTVTSVDGRKTTASAGEVIFLRKDTELTYAAEDAGAELVYVMYPHWTSTQLASDHADLVETFHPADRVPPRFGDGPDPDIIAWMKRIWDPLERGESHDYGPFFDALADDVVLELSVGEVRGKQAVIDYYLHASATLDFQPFERPLEYFADGNRVVILGSEIFTIKESGATHRAEWAWVLDVADGVITRILGIEDLAGVADFVRQALAKARSQSS
jgi:ethanolamine utilization protein EutQ